MDKLGNFVLDVQGLWMNLQASEIKNVDIKKHQVELIDAEWCSATMQEWRECNHQCATCPFHNVEYGTYNIPKDIEDDFYTFCIIKGVINNETSGKGSVGTQN